MALDSVNERIGELQERLIRTIGPLTGGGNLSADRELAISEATAATDTENGFSGSVVYAADSNTTARDMAATPAGVSTQINNAFAADGPIPGVTVITTSGTWTAPRNGIVHALLVGAGGAGGHGNQNEDGGAGGGGAGGASYWASFPVSRGQVFQAVVGTSTPPPSPGMPGRGGSTVFGGISCLGGSFGRPGSAGESVFDGSAGGRVSPTGAGQNGGGRLIPYGSASPGSGGAAGGGFSASGGGGGAGVDIRQWSPGSPLPVAGQGGGGSTVAGKGGSGYGAGGGGSYSITTASGGAGAPGVIVLIFMHS